MIALFVVAATASAAPNFDDIVIKGEVQKPEILVLITRENLNKNYQLELKASFVDRIIVAADKALF